MPPPREHHEIDPLLEGLAVSRARETLWNGVQEELARPERVRPMIIRGHPIASRAVAVAAIVLSIMGGAVTGTVLRYRAPIQWEVSSISGVPTVAGASLTDAGRLGAGEWLVTDSVSSARLAIGGIGTAEVGPNSRVRLDRGRSTEHRLTLEQGSIYAFVDAPPRLFFIETPTALATDLGCAYIMEVDSAGVTRIWVTSGWVEFKTGERVSLVAAGLVAEIDADGNPGTPYPRGIAEEGHAALVRLDGGSNDASDLEMLVAAMYPQSLAAPARAPTTITLWHLLQRLDGELRTSVFEALSAISPPPVDVTREGILSLNRPMLERWRRDLVPMWSEEDVSLAVRAVRRLWEWTMR